MRIVPESLQCLLKTLPLAPYDHRRIRGLFNPPSTANPQQVAVDCGTTSTAIGTVFLARGAGAILGATASAKLYAPPTRGNMVMEYTMVALTAMLMYVGGSSLLRD